MPFEPDRDAPGSPAAAVLSCLQIVLQTRSWPRGAVPQIGEIDSSACAARIDFRHGHVLRESSARAELTSVRRDFREEQASGKLMLPAGEPAKSIATLVASDGQRGREKDPQLQLALAAVGAADVSHRQHILRPHIQVAQRNLPAT